MLLSLLTTVALGQTPPAFDAVEEAGQAFEEPETQLSAELGGTHAGGNSVFFTLNGATEASHQWARNRIGFQARGNLGRSVPDLDGDGRITEADRAAGLRTVASRVDGRLRYDRFFGARDSLYALAGGFIDPFAGYAWRTNQQIGYGRILLDQRRTGATPAEEEEEDASALLTRLSVEAGLDYAQETYVPDVDPGFRQILAGRLQVAFLHQFNENVSFDLQTELFENLFDLEDLRLHNRATLTTRVGPVLSVKLSHLLRFDNQPVTGFRPLDYTTMVTLVASIL